MMRDTAAVPLTSLFYLLFFSVAPPDFINTQIYIFGGGYIAIYRDSLLLGYIALAHL